MSIKREQLETFNWNVEYWRTKYLCKACILAVCIPVSLYYLYRSLVGSYLQHGDILVLQKELALYQGFAPFFYCVMGILAIAVGVPRSILSFLAGGIFNFWMGILLAEVVSLGGALGSFFYMRFARKTLIGKLPDNSIVTRATYVVNQHISQHSFSTVLLLRQMPVPGIIINSLCGLTQVRLKPFVMASILGFLPQNIIFALYGSGLNHHFLAYIITASSLLIILALGLYFACYYWCSFRTLLVHVPLLRKLATVKSFRCRSRVHYE